MPLQGRFEADFSSFLEATRKAELSLKSFESEGGKVEKQLNRVADSLSGRKLIQDAELMTRSVQGIGGAATLTEREQAKVNRVVTDAIEKYRALGGTAPPAMLALADATRKVEDSTSHTSRFVDDLTSSIKNTALGFISAQAAIGAVQAVFRGFSSLIGDSIQSFASAEAAEKKMTTALVAAGRATPATIGQFDDLATQFQKTTAYSDDLITEMEALLTEVGNVAPAEMKKALGAATDLASGLGIDLQSATLLVGKAFAGETGTLARYGVVVDQTALKAEGASAVIDAIQKKFGGQAQAALDTYAGRVQQLGNAFDNVKEAIGGAIARNPLLIAGLREISGAADGAAEGSSGFRTALEQSFAAMPQWVRSLKDLYGDLKDVADAENTLADAARNMSNVPTPKQFEAGGYGLKPLTEGLELAKNAWKEELAAEQKAKDVAEQHAHAIQNLRDSLSGQGAIKAARDMTEALRGTIPIQKMTADAQDNINRTMDTAIEVFRAQGKVAPQVMRDLWMATQPAITVVDGLGASIDNLGESLRVDIPAIHDWSIAIKDGIESAIGLKTDIDIPKASKGLFASLFGDPKDFGGQIASAIQGAIQGGGNVPGAAAGAIGARIGSSIGNSLTKEGGKFFNKALGDVFAGALPVVGSLLGPLTSAIWNKLFGTAGRDAVKAFAGQHQGFDALHKELNVLGAEGERLWIKLTQGTGRNNPEQAAATIAEITKALEALKINAAAAGTAAAAEAGTITDSHQQALDAIKSMNGEMSRLFDSIKDEAPEKEMGVVERQTRDRIAAVQKERDAAQKALDDTVESSAVAAKKAGDIIDTALAARLFHIRVKADIEGLDGVSSNIRGGPTPQVFHEAAGGDFIVRRPTLFLAGEAGPERATFSGGGRTGATTEQPTPIIFNVDGQEWLRQFVVLKKRYVG